jgi:LacI family transcriptional regulator
MMVKTTIGDVAAHAGVSKATVSRVLNNDPNVADDLRLRVQKSAQALGYKPNRAARRLKKNLNDVVGFLIPGIQNPFFASILRGAEDLAYENGIGILAYSTADDVARQQVYLERLQGDHVAGIVIVAAPSTRADTFTSLSDANIPVVLLDRSSDEVDVDVVRVDSLRGAYLAVQHLIALGYKRIGTINGLTELSTGRERLQGYRLALADAGLPAHEDLITAGDFLESGGYEAMRRLMHLAKPPDAIFVANNLMMVGALTAIRELGIRVPEQVALVGFDDLPLSALLTPPLTVMAQPTYELGREALRLLMQRMKTPDALPRTVTLPAQLIVRESCGAVLRGNKD